jgi:ribosome-binding factor A
MSWRLERIGEQIRGELSRLVRDELRDPRIGLLTLTRVEVSADLSAASVFWSPLDARGDRGLEEVGAGLASASGFLRRRLADELSLRRTPELRFRHDPSIERGAQTLNLLRSLEPSNDRTSASEDGREADRDAGCNAGRNEGGER